MATQGVEPGGHYNFRSHSLSFINDFMFNIEPFTITTVYGGHKISLITKKLRRNLNTTSVNTSRTKILLFVGTNDAHSLDFNFLTFKYDYIDLMNTIKLILPNSIILLTSLIPCLKDRDFNVDFINDRILILNNVINEICIERKDCNYFNIHTMFTNFILQGLSQQYYKYDGLHMSYSGITMVNKTLAISYKNP